jgi:hypothetical protein
MRAFKVHLNGKQLCLAGIGDDGVLTAIVSWVTGAGRADLFLEVGGLVSPIEEHVKWVSQEPLRVGDEIRVKVVETSSVDRPTTKHRTDPAKDLRSRKRYVRAMAKQFGWKIQARRKKAAS